MAKKYIDADVLKRIIGELEYQNSNKLLSIAGNEVLDFFMPKIIDDTPAADVQEVRHGEWAGTVCTACGESTSFYYDCKYCPNCGARMEGEENEM